PARSHRREPGRGLPLPLPAQDPRREHEGCRLHRPSGRRRGLLQEGGRKVAEAGLNAHRLMLSSSASQACEGPASHPPKSRDYFVEILGLPKKTQKDPVLWVPVRLSDGWYGIVA